jgi:hypothetical protein
MQPMYAHMVLRAAAGRSATRCFGRVIPFNANHAVCQSNFKVLLTCRGFSSPAAATSTTEAAPQNGVSTGTTAATSEDWVRDVIQKIMLEQSQLSTTQLPINGNEGLSSSARDLEKSLQALQVRGFIATNPLSRIHFSFSRLLPLTAIIRYLALFSCRYPRAELNLFYRTNLLMQNCVSKIVTSAVAMTNWRRKLRPRSPPSTRRWRRLSI